MARFVLCLMFLAEILGAVFGVSTIVHLWPALLGLKALYFIPALLTAVFMPVTLVFLFSTFCQLNDQGELLRDSLVAKIAMRISKEVEKTGELRYCPTFWKSVSILALLELGSVAAVSCVATGLTSLSVGAVLGSLFTGLKFLFLATSYVAIAVLVERGISHYFDWRTGSKNDNRELLVKLLSRLFFVAWVILWFIFFHLNEYVCFHNIYLSCRDSFAAAGIVFWVYACGIWLFLICGKLFVMLTDGIARARRTFADSLVYREISAMKDELCPKVRIASK
ncbi:MAG: hypothetical protein HY226_06615 [Candidatus Vogelbacteria bacterium]|nr:hypothetical protein [Candidatus Vogelbacteria bacterium]